MKEQFEDSYRHKGMRKALVRKVSSKGISNPAVLAAMERVPRHIFFERAFLEHAYQDKAFPIGHGQTISQPYTVAFQTQLLDPKPEAKVLEVGTGSGYQASILLELGVRLYTIEYQRPLYEKARWMLHELGYKQVSCFCGDGSLGLPAHAPYDGIIVTAGAPTVPKALISQLTIGGRLIIPVGDHQQQKMLRLTRVSEQQVHQETFDHFSFVPLRGEQGWNTSP